MTSIIVLVWLNPSTIEHVNSIGVNATSTSVDATCHSANPTPSRADVTNIGVDAPSQCRRNLPRRRRT